MPPRRYDDHGIANALAQLKPNLRIWLADHSDDERASHVLFDQQIQALSDRAPLEQLIALTVLATDLTQAAGAGPIIPPEAQRIVVQVFLDRLYDKAPGKSVEVRVPPFAAIQCVEGPAHTRGTPPNTIETDALTWIRLSTGRAQWAGAVEAHQVIVSGTRADLSALLPLT
jgi:hypothetical protein